MAASIRGKAQCLDTRHSMGDGNKLKPVEAHWALPSKKLSSSRAARAGRYAIAEFGLSGRHADLIEVSVIEHVVAGEKEEFELKTPKNKTFFKELILIPSPTTGIGLSTLSTLSTQNFKHSDIKEYTINQLQGVMMFLTRSVHSECQPCGL